MASITKGGCNEEEGCTVQKTSADGIGAALVRKVVDGLLLSEFTTNVLPCWGKEFTSE